MIAFEEFSKYPAHRIFRCGIITNSPITGAYMIDKYEGRLLKFVAVKGEINDWCIYVLWDDENTFEDVEKHGDKITQKEHILNCVHVDKETLNNYRK